MHKKCGQAIPISEYKYHAKEDSCLPLQDPKIANRCPLCNEDIKPGK